MYTKENINGVKFLIANILYTIKYPGKAGDKYIDLHYINQSRPGAILATMDNHAHIEYVLTNVNSGGWKRYIVEVEELSNYPIY